MQGPFQVIFQDHQFVKTYHLLSKMINPHNHKEKRRQGEGVVTFPEYLLRMFRKFGLLYHISMDILNQFKYKFI